LNNRASVDLFIATHARFFPVRFLAAGLAAQIESGQAERVGIRTESASAIRKVAKYLENNYECNLAAASFDFSLTNPKNEKLIQVCKDCNVIPLISDPLDGGLASGVFTATNPSGGGTSMNAKFSFKELEKLQPLHSVQETLTERVRTRVRRNLRDTQDRYKSRYGPPREINTDITTSQIAIAYAIAKGGVPLVPVNNPAQAAERVLGCLGWQLEEVEVAMLDSAVALCKIK
jgi:aryl-alcohol dehydrogenase-like predicted oxidoreductase